MIVETALRAAAHLPGRLRAARLACDLTQQAAANALGVARTTLVAIEKGERAIRSPELVTLARLYHRDVADLLRNAPPAERLSARFRTALGRVADGDDAREAMRLLEGLADDYRELERLTEQSGRAPRPGRFQLGRLDADVAGSDLADRERSRLGLGDAPLGRLRELLETVVGLRVFSLPLPSHVAGCFIYDEELGPLVVVNANHPPEKQAWTLAHEYFHFLTCGDQPEITIQHPRRLSREERAADAFARELLMPRAGVARLATDRLRASPAGLTAADIVEMADHWGASFEAMCLRLEGLRMIPVGSYDRLRLEGFRVGEARALLGLGEREPDGRLLPARYIQLAIDAYDGELISEGRLARFLRRDRVAVRGLGLLAVEERIAKR